MCFIKINSVEPISLVTILPQITPRQDDAKERRAPFSQSSMMIVRSSHGKVTIF
jgi:hypothetical protein